MPPSDADAAEGVGDAADRRRQPRVIRLEAHRPLVQILTEAVVVVVELGLGVQAPLHPTGELGDVLLIARPVFQVGDGGLELFEQSRGLVVHRGRRYPARPGRLTDRSAAWTRKATIVATDAVVPA